MQAIHKSPTGCNTRPLSISKVSWMFDLYFLIYYSIQFYCAIQDGRHMLDDKSTIKDNLHYLLVALYLFPKFHECLRKTYLFIAWFSFIAQFKMATMTAMLDNESATKDTVQNLLVVHYLFPKFHECLTYTFWFIA